MADNNGQNDYSNFNEYNIPQTGPVVYLTPDQLPNTGVDPEMKRKANALGVWSIVVSTLSCCCCGATGIIGVLLGIIGLTKDKKNAACVVGIILGGLLTAYAIYMLFDIQANREIYTQAYNEFMQTYTEAYNEAYNEALQNAGAIFRFWR